MKRTLISYILGGCLALSACQAPTEPVAQSVSDSLPSLFPDYIDVTLPPRIAPPNFRLKDDAEKAVAALTCEDRKLVVVADEEGKFRFAPSDWKQLAEHSAGKSIEVKLYSQREGKWQAYPSFQWHISTDPTDDYLVYRLIEPGYELWNRMGIYQRRLADYDQTTILDNSLTNHNCMNCHSFRQQSPDQMLLHMRAELPGTYLINGEEIEKLNTKVEGKINTLVYPSWHPTGKFIAFSVNNTRQAFHLNDSNRVEVYDLSSDVVVYDVERHEVITDSLLFSGKAFETFPTFSPDGKTLFFCSAEAKDIPKEFKEAKYSLCSIGFNAETRSFGHRIDTLYSSTKEKKSVSFPRVSPDGRFLVFTVSSYGNFSIWHKDADLYLADLSTGSIRPLTEANSPEVESYHSWSSNSRWLVFSSRRMDGLYTHPYLVHIDPQGRASKPFILPQENPDFYPSFMYSYNIPEFVKGKVKADARSIAKVAREAGKGISMK